MLLKITMIINLILLIMFTLTTLFMDELSPKVKAKSGIILGILVLFYFITLLGVTALGLIKHNFIYVTSILFILMPFVIGHFVEYKTLKLYSFIQILVFALSLGFLYWLM